MYYFWYMGEKSKPTEVGDRGIGNLGLIILAAVCAVGISSFVVLLSIVLLVIPALPSGLYGIMHGTCWAGCFGFVQMIPYILLALVPILTVLCYALLAKQQARRAVQNKGAEL